MKRFNHLVSMTLMLVLSTPVLAKIIYLGPVVTQGGATSQLNKSRSSRWVFKASFKSFEVEGVKAFPLREEFSKVEITGLKNAQTVGAPALPYRSFIVKGTPSELKVDVSYKERHFFKNIKTVPAPLKPCRCEKSLQANQNLFSYDSFAYEQREDRLVEMIDLGDFRGQKLTQVIIRPMLQTGRGLHVYEDLEVSLEREGGLAPQDFQAMNQKMIVVTPRKLLAGTNEFVAFKRETGFDVELVVYEDVASSASDLQNFLHGKFKQTSYQYAVLVGHQGLLPTMSVATSSDPKTPSDYPYFTMGGSQDVFPDVFYGRLVADNNEEVSGQVFKMREYRDSSWGDNRGTSKSVGIASNEGWNPTDVEYMRQMMGPLETSLGIVPSYFFQDNNNSKPSEINKALNQGARWMNYIGHGSGHSWSSVNSGEYHSDDIKKLRPGAVKPVIIDVACQNGRFTYEGKLGERFMNESYRGKPVGAVAYYGGSVDISWDPPAVMAVAINNELATQRTQGLFQLIMKGQRHLIENFEDVEAARENLLWYHLFGDPSMEVVGF